MAETSPEPALTGGAATKQAIADAARALFPRHGYTGTSVRQVAAAAGADPALVIRYFGSKERLFLETVPVVGHFEHVTSGPLEGLGRRLVESLVAADPEVREMQLSTYRAMMRASDSPTVRARLVESQEQMFIAPLAPRLSGKHPELRARLVAAQVAGLLDGLAMLEDPRLAEADVEALVEQYGAAIQRVVDGF
jgi:AcrR family transcriptional regulator